MKVRLTIHVKDEVKLGGKIRNTLTFVGDRLELENFLFTELQHEYEITKHYFTNLHNLKHYAKD